MTKRKKSVSSSLYTLKPQTSCFKKTTKLCYLLSARSGCSNYFAFISSISSIQSIFKISLYLWNLKILIFLWYLGRFSYPFLLTVYILVWLNHFDISQRWSVFKCFFFFFSVGWNALTQNLLKCRKYVVLLFYWCQQTETFFFCELCLTAFHAITTFRKHIG